jgi:hypothetical protein
MSMSPCGSVEDETRLVEPTEEESRQKHEVVWHPSSALMLILIRKAVRTALEHVRTCSAAFGSAPQYIKKGKRDF